MTLLSRGLDPRPEIMVPLVGSVAEFTHQKNIIENVAQQVFQEHGKRVQYKIGTMVTMALSESPFIENKIFSNYLINNHVTNTPSCLFNPRN